MWPSASAPREPRCREVPMSLRRNERSTSWCRQGRFSSFASPVRQAQQRGGGAMIGCRRFAEAPDDVVVERRAVGRQFSIAAIAEAGLAGRADGLPAAVAIGDDVGAAVFGIDAGADPGDGGRLRTGGAGVRTPAATAAQHTI